MIHLHDVVCVCVHFTFVVERFCDIAMVTQNEKLSMRQKVDMSYDVMHEI